MDEQRQEPASARQRQSLREICHDLRQPIATISALAAAARTQPRIPQEVLRRLDQISGEARRMSELVKRLLDDQIVRRLLDAGRVAAEVAATAGVTFPGIIQVIAEAGTIVVADEIALRRAVANLIQNATRAAGPGGTVLVRVRKYRRWVRCEVNDSGPGFGEGPPGMQSLGLTIVDRLVQTHGGRLDVLESSLGGALLRLSLPIAKLPDPTDALP